MAFAIGVYPQPLLDVINPFAKSLMESLNQLPFIR
jgi:hypothetical protein